MPGPSSIHPWPRRSSTVRGRYRIFDVAEEEFDRPDGAASHSFFVIEAADWVNVVPITPDDRVVLVRQFRVGTGEVSIEVPGGMVDPGEADPSAAALRELEEETGYVAESIAHSASIAPNPAILRNHLHMYVARGVRPIGAAHPDADELVEAFEATWDEIDAMVRAGQVTHALTLTALLYARYLKG